MELFSKNLTIEIDYMELFSRYLTVETDCMGDRL